MQVEYILDRDIFEPQKAVEQIHRCLKMGGIAFFRLPFLHPYHGQDYFDGYRFTKDGLKYLFKSFSEIKIQPCGDYINVLLNFITGFKLRKQFFIVILEKPLRILVRFLRKKTINRLHNPMGFNILAKK